jgi:uncharacterized protein DUF2505
VKFRHENHYDACVEDVVALQTDQAYRSSLRSRTRSAGHEVTVTEEGGTTVVLVDQRLKTEGIPSFAQKLVGDTIHLKQREEWNGNRATFELTIPGKPGHLRGTVTVEPDGEGAVERLDGEAKASIPLVGGKIEKLLVDLVSASLDRSQARAAAWLAGER